MGTWLSPGSEVKWERRRKNDDEKKNAETLRHKAVKLINLITQLVERTS